MKVDLPWNPMIIENRIGRVQRLTSTFAHVLVYKLALAGTFDATVVGRLAEKLQVAADAIGDVDALFDGAGYSSTGDDDGFGFEELIRRLVWDVAEER